MILCFSIPEIKLFSDDAMAPGRHVELIYIQSVLADTEALLLVSDLTLKERLRHNELFIVVSISSLRAAGEECDRRGYLLRRLHPRDRKYLLFDSREGMLGIPIRNMRPNFWSYLI